MEVHGRTVEYNIRVWQHVQHLSIGSAHWWFWFCHVETFRISLLVYMQRKNENITVQPCQHCYTPKYMLGSKELYRQLED